MEEYDKAQPKYKCYYQEWEKRKWFWVKWYDNIVEALAELRLRCKEQWYLDTLPKE